MGFISESLMLEVAEQQARVTGARAAAEIAAFKSPENIASIVEAVAEEVRKQYRDSLGSRRTYLVNLAVPGVTAAVEYDVSCRRQILQGLNIADPGLKHVSVRLMRASTTGSDQREVLAGAWTVHIELGY